MTNDQIIAQLWAIRAIVDALAANLNAASAPTATGCEHPEESRENASTIQGPKQFYCRACKEIVTD